MTQQKYPVTASQIEPGYYYEKANSPGWLRKVINHRGGYVDFTGASQCHQSSLAWWATAAGCRCRIV